MWCVSACGGACSGLKSEPFPHHPQARPLSSCWGLSKGRCVLFLAFLAPLPPAPMVPWDAFVLVLCWKGDKHFPPPAARVAPPETTAGGGAASSAPYPPTLYPFQATACLEACLADPTQTRYRQHSRAGSNGRKHSVQLPHLTVKVMEAQRRKAARQRCPACLWQSQDACLPEPTALQGWPLEEAGWEAGPGGEKGRPSSQGAAKTRGAVGSHPPGGWGLYLCYFVLLPPRSELCIQSVLQNVG